MTGLTSNINNDKGLHVYSKGTKLMTKIFALDTPRHTYNRLCNHNEYVIHDSSTFCENYYNKNVNHQYAQVFYSLNNKHTIVFYSKNCPIASIRA